MAASSQGVNWFSFIAKLRSNSTATVKKTLQTLTKLTRKSENIKSFQENGGIAVLIELLSRPNKGHIDFALSVLANCALEEQARKQIVDLNGISPIVTILQNIKETSIQNRASRALANLAKSQHGANIIKNSQCMKLFMEGLQNETNEECRQSMLRAVRELCTRTTARLDMSSPDAVRILVELLKSENESLRDESIRILAVITRTCNKEVALQIQDSEGIKPIVQALSSKHSKIQQSVVQCLHSLSRHPHVRVSMCTEGAVDALVSFADISKIDSSFSAAVEAICLCCREAVNRNKVVQCGGLDLLVRILSSKKHSKLHEKIIAAFICFFYHEVAMEKLVALKSVPILINILSQLNERTSENGSPSTPSYDQFRNSPSYFRDHPELSPISSADSSFKLREPSPKRLCLEEIQETFDKMVSEHQSSLDLVRNSKTPDFKIRRKQRQRSSESSPVLQTGSPLPFQDPSPEQRNILPCGDEGTDKLEKKSRLTTSPTSSVSGKHESAPIQNINGSATPIQQNTEAELCEDTIPVFDTPMSEKQDTLPIPKRDDNEVPRPSSKTSSTLSVKCGTSPIQDNLLTMASQHHYTETSNPAPLDSSFCSGVQLPSPLSKGETSPIPDKDGTIAPHQQDIGQNILLLLWRFSHLPESEKFLVSRNLFEVLLDHLVLDSTPAPRCVRLLEKLTGATYFEAVIREKIPLIIHRQLFCGYRKDFYKDDQEAGAVKQRSTNEKFPLSQTHVLIGYRLLSNLTSLAMSPFGKGVLAHMLLTGNPSDVRDCALSLPFLCRSETVQKKLLFEYSGMKHLFQVLEEPENEETAAMATESVAVLASVLGLVCNTKDHEIKTPGADMEKNKLDAGERDADRIHDGADAPLWSCTSSCRYTSSELGPHDVHFVLDSGDQCPGHRYVLSGLSHVFEALLSRGYAESAQRTIPFRDTPYEVFRFVLHRAYGCQAKLPEPVSEPPVRDTPLTGMDSTKDVHLHFVMDLHVFADKFLLDDLKKQCESYMLSKMRTDNAHLVYTQGRHYHSQTLRHCVVRHILVKETDIRTRYLALRRLLLSTEREYFLQDMKSLIDSCL